MSSKICFRYYYVTAENVVFLGVLTRVTSNNPRHPLPISTPPVVGYP